MSEKVDTSREAVVERAAFLMRHSIDRYTSDMLLALLAANESLASLVRDLEQGFYYTLRMQGSDTNIPVLIEARKQLAALAASASAKERTP